jgi:hypothetical protein
MSEAVAWIKKTKEKNAPIHIARGCNYPACYRARVADIIPDVGTRMGTAGYDADTGLATHILVISNRTQHIIGIADHNHAVRLFAGTGVVGTAVDEDTGRIAVHFKDAESLTVAELIVTTRKMEDLATHVSEGCDYYYCAQTRLAAQEETTGEIKAADKLQGDAKKKAKKKARRGLSRGMSSAALGSTVSRAVEKELKATRNLAELDDGDTFVTTPKNGVSTSVTSAASEGKEAHPLRPSEPYADPSSPSRAGAVGVVRNGGMDHPEDRHRLWVSKDTQHFCDMENHDHAHEMLVLETLRSTHAVSHQTNGKICIYFKTDDEMSEAIEWIKKKKEANIPAHIARGCDYPACYRARMKTSGGATVVSRSITAMSTVFSTVAGSKYVLLVSNSTQHVIGLHAGNANAILEGMGVEGTAMDATTGRIAVSFKDLHSMDAAEQWMTARKSEELVVHVAEGCNFPYCAQTRLAMNEVTETQGWGQGYNIATSSTKMTAVKEEVISLQQGTMFDLTLSHEACDDSEYLVTDVSAPVGVCAASKNVLTYTPPFDYIGRVIVTYKTTVQGQAPEEQTLLIDVTEAPKPEVTRFTMPQGATAKIALTAEGCDDDECIIEEATADLGACSMEGNVLMFTSPADKVGDVLLTYRGRVKGGPPQVREIIVTLTEADATLEPTTLDFTANTAMIYTSLSRANTTSSRTSTAGEAKYDGAWEELTDPDTGRVYYFNAVANESTWTRPRGYTGMRYILVFSNDTQHILGMNDHGHRGLEMVAHLPITNIETNAETGNVQMSFADEAGLKAAVAWAKARKIEELPKHVERECTHAFCEHTRLSAEVQTRVEVEAAEAIAAGRTGAAKKNATEKVNHLKSRRVSMSAMSFSVNRAVEKEEATERAAADIVARTMYTHLTVARPPRAPALDSKSGRRVSLGGTEHPGDRHRLWITKDTQHFCGMENHDHAHESKLPIPLRLALNPHMYCPPHVAHHKSIACFAALSSSHTTPPPHVLGVPHTHIGRSRPPRMPGLTLISCLRSASPRTCSLTYSLPPSISFHHLPPPSPSSHVARHLHTQCLCSSPSVRRTPWRTPQMARFAYTSKPIPRWPRRWRGSRRRRKKIFPYTLLEVATTPCATARVSLLPSRWRLRRW